MTTYIEKVSEKLNLLIEKNNDAEKGYAKAAEIAKAPSLIRWFNDRSVERRIFNEALQKEVAVLGQAYDDEGSLKGDLHRTWMDVKALFSVDNDQAMLREAERGEKATSEEYNKVLDGFKWPSSTEKLLLAQRVSIEAGIAILKSLEDIEYQEES